MAAEHWHKTRVQPGVFVACMKMVYYVNIYHMPASGILGFIANVI